MTRTTLTVLFFLFALSSFAQEENNSTGKITGKIIDSLTSKSMEYATIGLFTQSENKIVNGTTSDSMGIFTITNVKEGTYKIIIEFIGYKKSERNNIVITKANQIIQIGNIKISTNQTSLKEVTITAEKNIIENKIDKTIYNVDKDVTSQSGVAADVLKNVPQVFVDVDGNVELQGSSNIRFLINGKPSILFGSNVADVLQSIPASQIKSIEIITSPGTKYDASGTGGIINIILKKSTAQGINGNVSLSAGTRLENGSLNLNIRKGNFGINAFASGNAQLSSTTINTSDRFSQDTSASSHLLQNGKSDFNRNGFQYQ
ncbi:MAG: carboxypeptidase regulatory-like domain-containing protein, partial [Bacteroidota bacterium]